VKQNQEKSEPDPIAPPAKRAAAMRFIMIVMLIDMASIGIIIPVLPVLVGQFTGSLAEQAFWFGAVTFTFSVANFFASPVLGALSDTYGRRPILLIGFCGFAISFFVTAVVTQLWLLVAIRLVSGALMANAAIANAYVADITPPEERAQRFGQLGAMLGLGFILGPAMGGILGELDVRLPFIVAGCGGLLNLAYGWFVLPESLPAERRRPMNWRAAMNPFAALARLGRLEGIGMLVLAIGLGNLAQFVLQSTWVLYTTFRFDWSPMQNGWSLFLVGAMSFLVQGLLLKRLTMAFGTTRLAIVGMVSNVLCHLGWALATSGWMMYALIALNLLGYAVVPTIQAMVSRAASAEKQGEIMGAVGALGSLAAVLGPVIGAPLLGAVSHLPPADWRMGAPFFFTSALLLACATIGFVKFGTGREPKPR
jgi:MFS transporter, DHA1 family, tetracycline resistance protein